MKKKTLEYLIYEIGELKIKDYKLQDENIKLKNEKAQSDNIILNYKQEVANLRLALSTLKNQETNTKKIQPEVIITDKE